MSSLKLIISWIFFFNNIFIISHLRKSGRSAFHYNSLSYRNPLIFKKTIYINRNECVSMIVLYTFSIIIYEIVHSRYSQQLDHSLFALWHFGNAKLRHRSIDDPSMLVYFQHVQFTKKRLINMYYTVRGNKLQTKTNQWYRLCRISSNPRSRETCFRRVRYTESLAKRKIF